MQQAAVKLWALEDADAAIVAAWTAEPESAKWLHFGPDLRALTPTMVRLMMRRSQNVLRLFAPEGSSEPAGIVALADRDLGFGSASLWYLLGDKRLSRRGLTGRAVSRMLSEAFDDHGVSAVSAWAVDGNAASVRILERCGFSLIGRQRRCHRVDGVLRDRLLFDLVAADLASG
jgi:RimJ/RimL family protein N-acetyltransferase